MRSLMRNLLVACLTMQASLVNAAVTITITSPSGGNTYSNGYVFNYIGNGSWGAGDPSVNEVHTYIVRNNSDPSIGVVTVSETAQITATNYQDGSGDYDFTKNGNLPATLENGDTIGGTYYFAAKPFNSAVGPYKLNPPNQQPQLYTSKTITITP